MTFAYTPDRALYRQTSKIGEARTATYVLGLLELEISISGVVQRHYIRGSDGVVAAVERRAPRGNVEETRATCTAITSAPSTPSPTTAAP
ncbi:MAG: hypothetical protein R2873_19310 [Caldilineaceae bacterium]